MKSVTSLVLKKEKSHCYSLRFLRKAPTKKKKKVTAIICVFYENRRLKRDLLDLERDHERVRYDLEFIEIINQIRDLTTINKALSDQLPPPNRTDSLRNAPMSREENTHDVVNQDILRDSDRPFGIRLPSILLQNIKSK